MPTFHSGVGGKMVKDAADFNIVDWNLTKTARIAEVTHSGSGGVAAWQKVLTEAQGSANFVWDSTNIPDTDAALGEGDTGTMELHCGDSTKFYSFPAIIESLQVQNNSQNDVVRGTINFKANGTITEPLT